MKRKSYSSFDEWKADYARFEQSPDDKHLMAYVVKCIENSPPTIKKQIKDYLSDNALDTNVWMILEQVGKENPDCYILVRSRDNPWFDC